MKPAAPCRQAGVLIADPDPSVRGLLTCGLRFQNFAVWEAESGAEAVELVRAHLDEIDLALIDLRLPGLGGLAVLTILEQLKPGLRCCLLGGDNSADEALRAAGAWRVFHKPFSFLEMARCLRAVQEGT
jgi:DNA-binding NtrC family response regulator